MKKRFAVFQALVLVFAVAPVLADAGSAHWSHSTTPFNVDVGDSVDSTWDAALATAATDWSGSSALYLTVVPGAPGRNCKGQNGRIEVCSATYGNNGWLSLVSLSVSGNHITKAVVKLNDTYLATASASFRQTVLCKDLGSSLGLTSGGPEPSCMNLDSEHPSAYDYLTLEMIYGHVDLTAAALVPPPAMELLELDGPGQWGRLVGRSADGLAELWVLDFGHGHKVFTHVVRTSAEATPGRGDEELGK